VGGICYSAPGTEQDQKLPVGPTPSCWAASRLHSVPRRAARIGACDEQHYPTFRQFAGGVIRARPLR
jgi:hypothetical protein